MITRARIATLLSLGAAGVCLVVLGSAGASCGGSDGTAATSADGSADGEVPGDGALPGNDGGSCTATGAACTTADQCCSGSCDQSLKVCSMPGGGSCKKAAEACASAVECCTLVCEGGKCGATQCTSDTKACTTDAQCCGGKCGTNKTCTPLNTTCRTGGNACATHGECCSKLCSNGTCSNRPSFCTQIGDVCSTAFECCTGLCTKAAGATLGTCGDVKPSGVPGCTPAGQVCGGGADGGSLGTGSIPPCGGECCSRSCGPYAATGVFICQPPSGCRPTGELCRGDKDCCGFGGKQGETGVGNCSVIAPGGPGRCDNGNACRPAGAICKVNRNRYPDQGSCNAENNCCGDNVNQNPFVCTRDSLGIPRCTIHQEACGTGPGTRADGGALAGQACASSADCCGLNCVPNPAFTGATTSAPFICGAGCVQRGNACTSTSDCCAGITCVTPPGSSVGACGGVVQSDGGVSTPPGNPPPPGACAELGQTCTTDDNCCGRAAYGIRCSSGRCSAVIR